MDMRHDDFEDLLGGTPRNEKSRAAGPRNGSEFDKESIPSQEYTASAPVSQEADDLDDLLGGTPASALDLPLPVSIFDDVKASRMDRRRVTLRQLSAQITSARAERKDGLPLLKLARFGDLRKPKKDGSPGHCLRWDENMLSATGIEGDYDAGQVSMESAAAMLEAAGIAALLYTSTHHTPEEPRWRVLCPLAAEVSRADREALCARLNGALGGILGEESFKPSQSYYFGEAALRDERKGGGRAHPLETLLINGKPLDKVAGVKPIFARDHGDDLDDLLGGSTSTGRKGQGKTGKPWSVILSALWAIPNGPEVPKAWKPFSDIAMALHEESEGSKAGFAAFNAWAAQHPSYDRKECWDRWKSFRPGEAGNIGGGTIITEAKKHGWLDPSEPDHTLGFDDLGEEEAAPEAKDDKPASRLTFLSPAQCATVQTRSYLIKGMLAERDVACVFGAPGAGKSLLTPFLGYAVAQGREAFGMRTKPGAVFYVAAEDEHGMRGRVRALQQAHGEADQFFLVGGVSNLLAADSPDLKDLARAVKAQRPKLIVIDTLAMAFPGLEENSADAMGRVVAVARALTKWGAAVILVHHDTKAEGGTPRGHSLLNGALDVALHVKKDESGVIRGKLTKNRNGTCDRDIAFRIAIEDGGADEDGDQITLPRCEELNSALAPEAVRVTPSERAVLDLIHTSGGEVSEADLRKLCIDGRKISPSDNPDSRRKATDRALKGLVQKGAVIFENALYRIFDDSCDDFDDLGPDNSDNVRTNPGMSKMAKRRNPDGHGHTPLGVSGCPDDADEGVL
ncbi:AAA family ATPase [Gemmobacter serpentinus]|uniref:AAA family ATPase n=1 Tax=Gemmobacter serpentinus TaxID=2652247 RepID=UPI00124DE885|nr:AAA family ATPase [Gemmobacter serpentinus]